MKTTNLEKLAIRPNSDLFRIFSFNGKKVLKKGKSLQEKTCNGQLYTNFQGSRILVKELAWALYFGNWPVFPLWNKDGDFSNCSIDNLLPVRTRLYRFRVSNVPNGYKHQFSNAIFESLAKCRRSWLLSLADKYSADLTFCLQIEAKARESTPCEHALSEVFSENIPYEVFQKKRPKVPEKMRAHWWKNRWVVVNEPKDISDDFIVRIEQALEMLHK